MSFDPTNDIKISEGRSKDRRFTDRILSVQGINTLTYT